MIKKELTELQARLMYMMQIYKWSNKKSKYFERDWS